MGTESNLPHSIQIRTARVNLGLTQKDLADALGVTTRTLLRWETGDVVATPEQLDQVLVVCRDLARASRMEAIRIDLDNFIEQQQNVLGPIPSDVMTTLVKIIDCVAQVQEKVCETFQKGVGVEEHTLIRGIVKPLLDPVGCSWYVVSRDVLERLSEKASKNCESTEDTFDY